MKRLIVTILGSSLLLLVTLLALSTQAQTVILPTITSITPNTGPNDRQTPITITGQGFTTSTLAYLDDIPLLRVTLVDSATLQARVPFGLVTGVYTLTVTDTETATWTNAFTVTQGIGWATGGPYGGRVLFLAVHPTYTSTVYALADQSSVFRTTDGAQHWELVLFSPTAGGTVAVSPVSPTVIFAGGKEGLYRSTQLGDSGSWTLVFSGTGGVYIRTNLAIAPSAPYTMYAALGGIVYHSADGGTSWQTRTLGLSTGSRWWTLAVDPTDAATAYAASSKGGDKLYQTMDAGQHWTPVYTIPQSTVIQSVATDPYSPTVVWLGTNGQGLHRSIDSGKTFTRVTSFPSQYASSVRFDPNRYRILVSSNSGLYSSDDGGETWQNIHPLGGCPGDVAVTPGDSNTIYACWVEKTTDGGGQWARAIEGIAANLPRRLAVSPHDPGQILMGNRDYEGYASHSGGNEWERISGSAALGQWIAAFDPVSPSVAYVDSETRIYKTTDDGQSWQPTGEMSQTGLPRQYDVLSPRAIAIHPLTHTTVYAGVVWSSSDWELDDGALYRSDNGGDTWSLVAATDPISSIERIVLAPGHPETIYLVSGPGGIWRSYDAGQTRDHLVNELSGQWVRAFAVSPDDPNILLAGGGASTTDSFGIWRSTNGGDSWQPASGLIRADERLATEIVYDPVDTRIVYAVTLGGLRYSVDGGQSWKVYPGPMGQIMIKSLAIMRYGDQTYLYLAIDGGAVTAQPTVLHAIQLHASQAAQSELLFGGGVYMKQGAPPVAGFTATPTSGVRPLNVVFTDASTGIVTDWLWDFGDTFTSTQANPTHIYSTTGVYTVALSVSGPDGINTLTRTNYITVTEPPRVPKWIQRNTDGFGTNANSAIHALEVFNGQLYAAAQNTVSGATVWRSANGITWTAVTSPAFGSGYSSTVATIADMIEFKGQLYAGAGSFGNNGVGQIWRTPNGIDWTQAVSGGLGNSGNICVDSFAVFSDTLYATTRNRISGTEIWCSSTGNSGDWTRVITNGFGGGANYPDGTGLVVFNDYLYAAVGATPAARAQIWRTHDGLTWTPVMTDGFGDLNNYYTGGWAVFNNSLYLGIRNDVMGGQIWRSDNGLTWAQVISNGLGDHDNLDISPLRALDGYLYVTANNSTVGMQVWRSLEGNAWTQANLNGFGDSKNTFSLWSNAHAVLNNRFFIGTRNTATGGEIWQKAIAADFTASPISGAAPLAVTFTNLSDGDYITSTWNLGDGFTSTQTSLTHSYTKGGIFTVTLTVSDDVDTSTLVRTNYIQAIYRIYLPVVLRNP